MSRRDELRRHEPVQVHASVQWQNLRTRWLRRYVRYVRFRLHLRHQRQLRQDLCAELRWQELRLRWLRRDLRKVRRRDSVLPRGERHLPRRPVSEHPDSGLLRRRNRLLLRHQRRERHEELHCTRAVLWLGAQRGEHDHFRDELHVLGHAARERPCRQGAACVSGQARLRTELQRQGLRLRRLRWFLWHVHRRQAVRIRQRQVRGIAVRRCADGRLLQRRHGRRV